MADMMKCRWCGAEVVENMWKFSIEENASRHPIYEIMKDNSVCAICAKKYFEEHEDEYQDWSPSA